MLYISEHERMQSLDIVIVQLFLSDLMSSCDCYFVYAYCYSNVCILYVNSYIRRECNKQEV